MLLRVRGCGRDRAGKMRRAATFLIENVVRPRSIIDEIDVTIRFMSDGFEPDVNAWCRPDRFVRPRRFTIAIRLGLPDRVELEMMAHEIVHVSQLASGRMRDRPDGSTVWMKKRYKNGRLNYYDSPWEIEAYGRQQGLVVRLYELPDFSY